MASFAPASLRALALASACLALVATGCTSDALSVAADEADGYPAGDAPPFAGGSGGGPVGDEAGAPPPPAGDTDDAVDDVDQPGPDASDAGPAGDDETDALPDYQENTWEDAAQDNLQTFSIDVDTASYTIMRRHILDGDALPPPGEVRVEEFLNFFDYDYPAPALDDETPFAVSLEAGPSPFGEGHHMLRVGVQGAEVAAEDRAPANLVFLVDTSGSMNHPAKIGLVQFSLKTLVQSLLPTDTLSIVTYASNVGTLLEPTPVSDRGVVIDAIESLGASGSTNGEGGIRRAYDLAEQAFRAGGINRVVLATDGDFNVGLTGQPLIDLISEFRERDIALSILGYGIAGGNYFDQQMEELTNHGDGNYAFVDSRNEALRVLGENLVGTLQVIAGDVKVQVELDPLVVSRYRLVGYDNRVLEDWEFADDTVDAAELGAGHNVTAFLELELVDDAAQAAAADPRKLAAVHLRYKAPGEDQSTAVSFDLGVDAIAPTVAETSDDFRWALGMAEYAEILRHSQHSAGSRFDDVLELLEATHNQNAARLEAIDLVRTARGRFSNAP